MKDKLKRFFIEKRDVLIFIGAIAFVFIAVFTIAGLALNNDDIVIDVGKTTYPSTPTSSTPTESQVPSKSTEIVAPKQFVLPISGEYKVVRTFFDINMSDDELVNAIIDTGDSKITSSGISYSKPDNSKFNVLAINDGEVVSVEFDDLAGDMIVVKHSDGLLSIYSSLEDVKVEIGDEVKLGDTLAVATTSTADAASGVHAHLQIKLNNKYVNPNEIYGKEIDDVIIGK